MHYGCGYGVEDQWRLMNGKAYHVLLLTPSLCYIDDSNLFKYLPHKQTVNMLIHARKMHNCTKYTPTIVQKCRTFLVT